MNEYQTASLRMVKKIIRLCDKYSDILMPVVAFQAGLTALKTKIAEIEDNEELSGLNLAGITDGEKNFEDIVCQITTDIAGLLYAYTDEISNNTLKMEVNLSLAKLRNKTGTELVLVCRTIYSRAAELKTELAAYGLTAELLTDLQEAIDDYETALLNPHAAGDKQPKEPPKQLFDELDEILSERIDTVMDSFRISHPELYEAYFNLREIPAHQLEGRGMRDEG